MLDKLIAITETEDFEGAGGVRFISAKQAPNELHLKIVIVLNSGSEQPWQIHCFGVRDFKLNGEYSGGLALRSNHPVLLPWIEGTTDLYFSSAASNPFATLGALWESHHKLMGRWAPFENFVNTLSKGVSPLLRASSGKLASGPESLMNAFANVLDEHGIRFSILPPRPPKYWDGEKWINQTTSLHALVFETSYVVAERFEAEDSAKI